MFRMSFAGVPFTALPTVWPMADTICGLDLVEPTKATTTALGILARCGTVAWGFEEAKRALHLWRERERAQREPPPPSG